MGSMGPSLVFWKIKVKKGRSVFRLVGFCFCNLIIKVVLVFMVYASCMGYLEGLTDVDQEVASHLRQ